MIRFVDLCEEGINDGNFKIFCVVFVIYEIVIFEKEEEIFLRE